MPCCRSPRIRRPSSVGEGDAHASSRRCPAPAVRTAFHAAAVGQDMTMSAHRPVRDVMTADVVIALQDTRAVDLAELMIALRLTAVPVLDLYDRVVGVVSYPDLFQHDPNASPLRRRKRLWRPLATSSTVGERMTSPAVTIPPDASIAAAARLMAGRGVGVLPVVDRQDKLVGIVGARDLLAMYVRPDDEIRAEIVREVLGTHLPSVAAVAQVDVAEAVVTLSGEVPASGMIPLAVHLTRQVGGVVEVVDQLWCGPPETGEAAEFPSAPLRPADFTVGG
ncbi:MAG: CBS domain-containing protein [Streptosporangiales bacterium]|nr:CBS domain-containing protein [Streptosporangiales bacterium]